MPKRLDKSRKGGYNGNTMHVRSEQGYTPAAAMPEHLIRYATLRQLQVFEAIVRLGSFTRAAEELFLTQPTVSMQIKKLTDAIGLPLFEHVGRNVQPTEAGRELYDACRRMFETLANLEMKMADLQGLKRGRLRLGVITTAKYFAPEILGEFSHLYPGIEVALKVSNRDSIIERMMANEDDLYIMGQAPSGELEVEAFPFAPNPLVVMVPRDHPLVGDSTSCAPGCVWNSSAMRRSSMPSSAGWVSRCCRCTPSRWRAPRGPWRFSMWRASRSCVSGTSCTQRRKSFRWLPARSSILPSRANRRSASVWF
jgi:DNA-binding transcriptional LysR family regulator